MPEGFEVHESVNGMVCLRRKQPGLISETESDRVTRRLKAPRAGHLYKVEVRGTILTIHESNAELGWQQAFVTVLSGRTKEAIRESTAHYQPVMRFILVDAKRRRFVPERFCFRGSVEDWISIGEEDSIERLAAKYLKHLGRDSMYELY